MVKLSVLYSSGFMRDWRQPWVVSSKKLKESKPLLKRLSAASTSVCWLHLVLCLLLYVFFSLLINWEHKRFSLLIIKMQEGLYLCCCGPASMHQIKNKSLFCFGIWQWRCSWWWSWFRFFRTVCRYLFMDTLLYLVLQCEAWTLLEPTYCAIVFFFSTPPFQDLFNCSHVKSFVVMCRTSAD
jgi:hypothetical protein